jgi:hypothetical protein
LRPGSPRRRQSTEPCRTPRAHRKVWRKPALPWRGMSERRCGRARSQRREWPAKRAPGDVTTGVSAQRGSHGRARNASQRYVGCPRERPERLTLPRTCLGFVSRRREMTELTYVGALAGALSPKMSVDSHAPAEVRLRRTSRLLLLSER